LSTSGIRRKTHKKRGRPKGQTKAQIIAEAAKTKRALELQIRGFSYSAISDQMISEGFEGISKTRAFQLVKAALEEAVADQKDAAKRLVALEMLRLDEMTKGLYVAARQGEPPSVNSMLNVMDRRARYAGIDAPTKTESAVYGKEGVPAVAIKQEQDAASAKFFDKVARAIAAANAERALGGDHEGGSGGSPVSE
jgi:hypothetical protein